MDRNWKERAVSPSETVAAVKSHHKVFLHGASAAPLELEAALCDRSDLHDVNLYHIHLEGEAPFAKPEMAFAASARPWKRPWRRLATPRW